MTDAELILCLLIAGVVFAVLSAIVADKPRPVEGPVIPRVNVSPGTLGFRPYGAEVSPPTLGFKPYVPEQMAEAETRHQADEEDDDPLGLYK